MNLNGYRIFEPDFDDNGALRDPDEITDELIYRELEITHLLPPKY
jgi:hypothetical protein